jgi:hypothetical protein
MKRTVTGIAILFLLAASCQVQLDPRETAYEWPAPDPSSPLIGTKWSWDSGWEAEPRTLYFKDAETMIYNKQYPAAYKYDKAKRKGQVETYGDFSVDSGFTTIHFNEWKSYGHGADFARAPD